MFQFMQHGHDRNPLRKMTPTPKDDEKINSPVNNTIVTQCQLQSAVEDHLEVLVQGTPTNTDTTLISEPINY